MRKSFTRLFKVFMLLGMLSLQVVAQGAPFGRTLSPTDGSCSASRTGDFVIDFDRNVYPNGLGVIALSNQLGTEKLTVQIPVNPGDEMTFYQLPDENMSVTFSADKIIIKLLNEYELEGYTPYFITVSEDAVKDGSGVFFDGLEDNNSVNLLPCVNNVPDWDFTTLHEGLITVEKFNPEDDEVDVSTNQGGPLSATNEYFEVIFDRHVYWTDDFTRGSALGEDWLLDGYFALYTSTDGFNSEYGGNVVAHELGGVTIIPGPVYGGDTLRFWFTDNYPLEPNAEYYLRVHPGIICDEHYEDGVQTEEHLWDGVNTNYEWNWSTKDDVAAEVDHIDWLDGETCPTATENIEIVIDDGSVQTELYMLGSGGAKVAVNASNIKQFIKLNGGDDFNVVSVSNVGNDVRIIIDPTPESDDRLASNTDYTVDVLAGMYDGDGEAIAAYSETLTSEDYTAPVSSTVTASADGTTFDILGRLNEVGTIYYIVVKRDEVTKDGNVDYWQPTAQELWDAIHSVGNTYEAERGTTSTTDDKVVTYETDGSIDVLDPTRTWHERITELDSTHGTYYNVYYLALDDACGGSNSISGAPTTFNATGVLKIEESTLDILPPEVVEWSGELADEDPHEDDVACGCSDDDADGIGGIKKMGPIYVEMNEAVEMAAGYGNAINTGAEVVSIFTVMYDEDGPSNPTAVPVELALDASQCSYDPATFTFTLVPRVAFPSGTFNDTTIIVTLNPNTIQDSPDDPNFGPNGTELLIPQVGMFCVEAYTGPVAVCEDPDEEGLWLWSPADNETMVDNGATITLAWDQELFAPVEDESPAGTRTEITNTPGSDTFIGKYIRIRRGDSYSADPEYLGGAIIYSFDPADPDADLDLFNFYFENVDGQAVITIEPDGYTWASEQWYRIEIEDGLQTKERLELSWSDSEPSAYSTCSPYNYYMTFQAKDNRPPEISFYEDDVLNTPDAWIQLLEGAIIQPENYILVKIDEWVQLGFDGFRDLSYTDTIIDANALRPYFTLKDPAGELIPFDMKYFSLDVSTDEASVYIDPYNYPEAGDEDPNWVNCEEGLEVCFLGGAGELNPLYEGDIFEDDAFNGVAPECDVFDIYCEPTPTQCLESITVNGIVVPNAPGDAGTDYLRDIGDITRLNLLTLDFEFGGAMDTIPGEILQLWAATGPTLIATINSDTGRDISPASDIIRYQFDLTTTAGWIDNEDYFVRITGSSMTSTSSVWDCDYPDPTVEAGVDTAVFFHTIDGTAPVVEDFIPDNDQTGPCLTDKDATDIIIAWDEPVTLGAGALELRREVSTGNIWVTSVNVADFEVDADFEIDGVPYGDTITFDVGELYNGVTEFCDLLLYGESYFFHMPEGFVENEVGLKNTAMTEDTVYTFCVGPNPPPTVLCDEYAPTGNIDTPLPEISIKFSEPVTPVDGARIQIHELGSPTSAVIQFDATQMHARNGGLEYYVTTEEVLSSAIPSFTEFEWDQCYQVNVDSAAFRDANGDHTVQVVTYDRDPIADAAYCEWEFCYRDEEPIAVQFWPEDGEVHVPVNAHLYAYLDDEPWVNSGGTVYPLVTSGSPGGVANAKQFFNVEYFNGTIWIGLLPSEYTLEFVGTDKQHLRITVYDNLGHDFDGDPGTANPTLQDETQYRLSVDGVVGINELIDINGNVTVNDTVVFLTEDITPPVVTLDDPCAGDESPNTIEFTTTIDEPGTIFWKVSNSVTNQEVTGSIDMTDETAYPASATQKVEGLNGVEDAYVFDVEVWASDDEIDAFDTEAEILAEWPWAANTIVSGDNFPGEEIERIQDFIPAPNWSVAPNPTGECTLCDDDKPLLIATYPEFGVDTLFPLADSIVLVFNETVQLNELLATPENMQGWNVNLRDFENNIGVPLAYEVIAGGATENPYGVDTTMIVLYPLDTTLVGTGLSQQLMPLADATGMRKDLDSERRYYLEIDRYAISDDDGCGSGVNYYPEVVGKSLWFKTADETAPCLVSVEPEDGAICVDPNADITVVFEETNDLEVDMDANPDSLFIYIYRRSDHSVPHERLALLGPDVTMGRNDDGNWAVTLPTYLQFRSNEVYDVRLPAGVFKDEFDNTWWNCSPSYPDSGYSWSFTIIDYMEPVPTSTVIENLSYLDVALADSEYVAEVYLNLPAGHKLEWSKHYDVEDDDYPQHIATSSFFKIEFDEVMYVKNTEKTDDYTTMYAAWNNFWGSDSLKVNQYLDDLYEMLTISKNLIGSTDETVLDGPKWVGGKWAGVRDYEIVDVDPGSQWIEVWVYNSEDHWSPLNTSVDYGFDSNSEYHVDLAANLLFEREDCTDETSYRALEAEDDFLTIVTRDDVPPTLDVLDGETSVCGGICVNAEGPLTLQFNTVVVQTPYVGIDYDSEDWLDDWYSGDVNWWTEANLPLRRELLLPPNTGNEFLTIERLVGAYYDTDDVLVWSYEQEVAVDDISISVVDGKTTIDVEWDEDLYSENFYRVIFKGGTVKDQDRIPDGNVFLGDTCIFQVEDNNGPTVYDTYPQNGDDVDASVTGLWIEYDQAIKKGAGEIEVRWMHGQQNIVVPIEECVIVDAIHATEDDTSITDNNVLYIPFPDEEALMDFRTYYVIVPAGFVTDINACHDIPSAAINLDINGYYEWVFMVNDATPPIAIEFIPNDVRDEDGNLLEKLESVPRGSDLTIKFDENIEVDDCATGGLFIYYNDGLDGFDYGDDFGNFVEFIAYEDYKEITGSDPYHGLTSDMITFDPENLFENAGDYVIRATPYTTGCGIKDMSGWGWQEGVGDTITWTFTVTNDIEPILAEKWPPYEHNMGSILPPDDPWNFAANTAGWATADSLVMVFTDNGNPEDAAVNPGVPVPVAANEGYIKIYEYIYEVVGGIGTYEQELWDSIDVNADNVVFSGNTVTVYDVKLRDDIGEDPSGNDEFYYVIVDQGAIKNANEGSTAFFAGIGDAFEWRFQTDADDIFLGATDILSPNIADDSTDAQNLTLEVASLLQVEFEEGVEALADPDGMLQVFAEGVTDPVAEVQIMPEMCEGAVLTVELAEGVLIDETNYNVVLQAGALGDTSTVSTPMPADFGGVGVWEFQTGDNTPPAPSTKSPAEDEECVLANIDLVMVFENESHGVTAGEGSITITDSNDVVIAELSIADAVISAAGDTVTFTVTNLPDTTVLTVNVPDSILFDGDPHSPLPNEAFTWNFTTGENTAPYLVALTPALVEADTMEMALEFSEVVAPVAGEVVIVGSDSIDAANFVSADGLTWTVEVDELASETWYNVTIAEGAFVDVNMGCTPNPVAETVDSFEVADILPPLASGSPTTAEDYVGLELNVQFDDAVTPATGNLVIYDAATDTVVETIAVGDFTATSNGDSLYVYTPTEVRYGLYYILIDAGAFVDADAAPVGVECPGITDPEEWTLAVVDPVFVDCYDIITPQRAERNVPVNTTISISFCDERIAPGTRADRFVTVGDQAEEQIEGENFFNYTVADSMIDGNTLTIEVEGLKENTTYSIIIAPGAITDEAGNEFAGITDANKWIFTTGDETAPVVTLTADADTINNETGVASITSSEVGTVYLAMDDVAPTAAGLEAAITEGKAVSGSALAADVPVEVSAEGLAEGTYKAYAIDGAGNIGEAENTVFVIDVPEIPVVTISEIQGMTDASPMVDEVVITSGVVTAIDGNGYFIQDANEEWSGIYVYDRTNNESVNRGSAVKIQATVAEYNDITELTDVTSLDYVAPMVVVEAKFVEEVTEAHEGLLVEVLGRSAVTATIGQTDDWTITSDGGVDHLISLYIYEDGDYDAELDYNYMVTGVVYGGNSEYKVEPRDEFDILNWSRINSINEFGSNVAVYPNPFKEYIKLEVSSNVVVTKAVITNIAGQLVKEVINPNNTIPTSELRKGVYFISLHTVDGIAKTERIIKR